MQKNTPLRRHVQEVVHELQRDPSWKQHATAANRRRGVVADKRRSQRRDVTRVDIQSFAQVFLVNGVCNAVIVSSMHANVSLRPRCKVAS